MRISEMMTAIANWLEAVDNEALLLAEHDEVCLNKTAEFCVRAAQILRQGAEELEQLEPAVEPQLTSETLDQVGNLATALDASGDEELQKAASAIDELLMTIAAPPAWYDHYKKTYDQKLGDITRRYQATREQLAEVNQVSEAQKAIEKSPMTKQYRIQQHALQTRSCPDHPGEMLGRVADGEWRCMLDGKVYNFALGYTDEKGNKVPGGSVALQGPSDLMEHSRPVFDTRQERLYGYNK
jgi:hypothetical protein